MAKSSENAVIAMRGYNPEWELREVSTQAMVGLSCARKQRTVIEADDIRFDVLMRVSIRATYIGNDRQLPPQGP